MTDVDREQREDRAFLAAREWPLLLADLDLEWAEHADRHRGGASSPGRRAGRYRTATGPRVHGRSLTTQGLPAGRRTAMTRTANTPDDHPNGQVPPGGGSRWLRALERVLTSGPYLPPAGIMSPLWPYSAFRSARGWRR